MSFFTVSGKRCVRDRGGRVNRRFHCKSEALKFSTVRKYRNTLNHLEAFCEERDIDSPAELTTDHLDAFRAGAR
jgi:site-specific recombinase XerD